MTVLVTGAGGFLGSHVTDLLTARGERPRVLMLPGEPLRALPPPGVELFRADVREARALRRAVRGVDVVFNCAAKTGPWGPSADYVRTNVEALESLVRIALHDGVRRIVHVSSVTVHGNDVGGDADENAPLRKEPNPYSRSKLAGEQLLTRMIREEGAPVTIVRPGWIYGPRDPASFARLAHKLETGRMVVVGPGSNQLPLIYVRDAARGVLLASEAPESLGRTYLLVNDEPVTQLEYLSAIAAQLRVPPPSKHVSYRMALTLGAAAEGVGRATRRRQPPPLMRYGVQMLGGENRFSIARARAELGFSPRVSMRDGVSRSVRWYRQRPEREPAAAAA